MRLIDPVVMITARFFETLSKSSWSIKLCFLTILADGSAALSRGGGRIQDSFDSKDLYYQAKNGTQPPRSVDLWDGHEGLAQTVYNQGHTDSCAANAAAAAFWYEEKLGRHENSWGSAGPSRLFIYWNARDLHQGVGANITDRGSSIRNNMKTMAAFGACPEADWPFANLSQINTKPSDVAYGHAAPHRITAYYRLDLAMSDQVYEKLNASQKDAVGTAVLENLRNCLTEGFPVAFGFWFYLKQSASWDTHSTPWVMKDIWTLPDSKFPRHTLPWKLDPSLRLRNKQGKFDVSGHAVLAIGYDDERQLVLVQNSWGRAWSGNGTFWMPYDWITDYAATNDFWTIRTVSQGLGQFPKYWTDVIKETLGIKFNST